MDLDDLVIDFLAIDKDEREAHSYEIYIQNCCGGGNSKSFELHDGESVTFFANQFNHAFFATKQNGPVLTSKMGLDIPRIERINWILPIIKGEISGTECWHIPREYTGELKRLYVVRSKLYVIWLEPRKRGGFKFSSAYKARNEQISVYQNQGTLFWKHA